MWNRIKATARHLVGRAKCSVGRHDWQDRNITWGSGVNAWVLVCRRRDCYSMTFIGNYPPMPPPPVPPAPKAA